MSNKRLERLYLAKRILKTNPDASADEIVAAVKARERARPDPVRHISQLLPVFRRKD